MFTNNNKDNHVRELCMLVWDLLFTITPLALGSALESGANRADKQISTCRHTCLCKPLAVCLSEIVTSENELYTYFVQHVYIMFQYYI